MRSGKSANPGSKEGNVVASQETARHFRTVPMGLSIARR